MLRQFTVEQLYVRLNTYKTELARTDFVGADKWRVNAIVDGINVITRELNRRGEMK